MSVDWDRLAGRGGAYLVERAAAAMLYGQLTPLALGVVEEEVERLKFILDEEISRLQPAGDLTPAAIAALRAQYQARLNAADKVIAAARRMEATAPTLPSPASGGGKAAAPVGGGGNVAAPVIGGGKEASQMGREEQAPSLPSPASGGGKVARERRTEKSLREFFADRSILILSYVGAFLLIVATLLFELSAFTAVDSTARFIGVLVLNLIVGLGGWACFRLPALRVGGRTYVAIAALMVPLTFVAAWVFLVLQQYGLSRDVAIAIAGTSCALLYGALAVSLESKGYALLTLIGLAVACGATLDVIHPAPSRRALLTGMSGAFLAIGHRTARFTRFHAAFSRLAPWQRPPPRFPGPPLPPPLPPPPP